MLRHGRGREFIVSCLIYWHFMGFWGCAAVASLDFGTVYVNSIEFRVIRFKLVVNANLS